MSLWRAGMLSAALLLLSVADPAATASTTTTVRCSSTERSITTQLVMAFGSSWIANSCASPDSRCSEECQKIQVNLATGLPNCKAASGTNFRQYYASMLAECTAGSTTNDVALGSTTSSMSSSGSGSSSSSDVGATITTPTPTKRSGASAMGIAGMCGFFAVLAFGHIY